MAVLQEEDRKIVIILSGDANAHHSEWLQGVLPTDRNDNNELDYVTCLDASNSSMVFFLIYIKKSEA